MHVDYSKRNGSDSSSHRDHGCIFFACLNEKKLQKANGMPIRPCRNSVQFTHGCRGQHQSHQPFPSDHMAELASPASLAMGWITYWSSGHQEMKHAIAEAGPLKTSSTSPFSSPHIPRDCREGQGSQKRQHHKMKVPECYMEQRAPTPPSANQYRTQ